MRAAIAEKGRAKAALPPTPPPEEQKPQMQAYNAQLAFNVDPNPNTLNPMYRDGAYMAQSAVGADIINVPQPQPAPPTKRAKPLPAAPFATTTVTTTETVHYTVQRGGVDDDFGSPGGNSSVFPPKGGARLPY